MYIPYAIVPVFYIFTFIALDTYIVRSCYVATSRTIHMYVHLASSSYHDTHYPRYPWYVNSLNIELELEINIRTYTHSSPA